MLFRFLKGNEKKAEELDADDREKQASPARELRKKRGSAIILMCLLFVSLTGALAVTYEAAGRKAAAAVSEAAFDLAGRSQLACYDKDLFDRYSILAFEGDEEKTGRRIKKIVSDSIASNKITVCRVTDVEAEQSAYSAADPDNLMIQIRQIEKKSAVPDLIGSLKGDLGVAERKLKDREDSAKLIKQLESQRDTARETAEQAAAQTRDQADNAAEAAVSAEKIRKAENIQNSLKQTADNIKNDIYNGADIENKGRELKNREISENLPSASAGINKNSAFSGGTLIKDLSASGANAASDDFVTIAYIESRFGNMLDDGTSERSFFRGEMEYILYGGLSDIDNYKKAYRAIFAVRTAMNSAFLFTDLQKSSETLAAAETLTPGPFAPLTRLLLIGAWAAIEAENDMKNLENGNGVPFLKSGSSWMTDLDSVVSGAHGSFIPIPGNSVMKYHRYLDMLLLTVERDTKLYRCLDLMQINIKGTVRDDFTIADHYTGFVISADISKSSRAAGVPDSKSSIRMTHTYYTEE